MRTPQYLGIANLFTLLNVGLWERDSVSCSISYECLLILISVTKNRPEGICEDIPDRPVKGSADIVNNPIAVKQPPVEGEPDAPLRVGLCLLQVDMNEAAITDIISVGRPPVHFDWFHGAYPPHGREQVE